MVCQEVGPAVYTEQECQQPQGDSPHGSKKHLGYMPDAAWRWSILISYLPGIAAPVVSETQTWFTNGHLQVSDPGLWFPREPVFSPGRGRVCGGASRPGWTPCLGARGQGPRANSTSASFQAAGDGSKKGLRLLPLLEPLFLLPASSLVLC